MKVLILSISAGSGHDKAAEAIKEAALKNIIDSSVTIVDALKYINPLIEKIVIGGYLRAIRNSPSIYSRLYNACDDEDTLGNVNRMLNDMLSQKVKALVDEYSPDVIVSTHPFHVEMLSVLKEKFGISIPVISIITDYSIHTIGIHDYVDAYVIPHEDIKNELIKRGVPEDRIFSLGIPVGSQFIKKIDKQSILDKMGLDNKKTILIMGGGLGLGPIKEVFSSLAYSTADIQIIIAAGHNKKLKKYLESIAKESSKAIRIFGYTDNISEIMSVSHILVTKPGGLTISEAMVLGLPIIILPPLPGQEERNSKYLVDNGIGLKLDKGTVTAEKMLSFVNNSLWIEQVKIKMREKARPEAAADIANLIAHYAKGNTTINKISPGS